MNRMAVGFTAAALLAAAGTWAVQAQDTSMSFFITSAGSGDGANLGGLEGADAICVKLAEAAGAGGKTWHAYLSTASANARDRIGSGPWYNAKGELIASNLDELHSDANKINKQTGLTEKGEMVPGRGETPNKHDILTGSNADGTLAQGQTCNDWTGNGEGAAMTGHHDRMGPETLPTGEIVECRPSVARLQPGEPRRHRRRRPALLLRRELSRTASDASARSGMGRALDLRGEVAPSRLRMAPAPAILITGTSSGIGHHAAHGLRKRGWRVFATVAKEADVARLTGEGFEAFRLDYGDPPSIAAALDAVLSLTGGRLDALFNNGAYAQAGALEDISSAQMRAQFEVNLFGWHELTRRVIPVMRRQGAGRIVFSSSVLGFVAAPYRGAYTASKFAVEGYADTLRLELAGSGIAVVLIEPGPITTRFITTARERIAASIDIEASVHREAYERELARLAGGESTSPWKRGPEAVFTKLILALESPYPKARYRVTVPTHVAAFLKRTLPTRALDRVLRGTRRRRMG